MDHKKNNYIKKFSDYIINFAFLYSSFVCFSKSIDIWENNKLLAILILFCGCLSFIAVFRYSIAKLIYFLKNKLFNNDKK
tara:strand:- start:313 stop:552 length:240 start_codon:yes stop_codon:yes gene_type:complete